jgi:transcriptional regulator with XRE-family HTH domain
VFPLEFCKAQLTQRTFCKGFKFNIASLRDLRVTSVHIHLCATLSKQDDHGVTRKGVAKAPNPIDQHVGSRVRMRRMLLGLSQEKLGEKLGVTFQQVQKYEKGMNRIGASRLQRMAEILDVPPSFFFDDAKNNEIRAPGVSEPSSVYVVEFLSTVEGLQLNKAFASIKDQRVRRKVVDLVVAIASAEGEKPAD